MQTSVPCDGTILSRINRLKRFNIEAGREQITQIKKRLSQLRREDREFVIQTKKRLGRLGREDYEFRFPLGEGREFKKLEFELAQLEAAIPTLPQSRLNTWGTVTVGRHKSLAQYKRALAKSRYYLDDRSEALARKIKISRVEKKIKLGKLTMRELGFKHTFLRTAFDTIEALGGRPLPDDVPLALICTPSFKEKHGIFFTDKIRNSRYLFELDYHPRQFIYGEYTRQMYYGEPFYTETSYGLTLISIDRCVYTGGTFFFMIPD